MATYVDADELQALLGLAGSDLYASTVYEQVADAASDLVGAYLDDSIASTTPAVREAALAVAVELWSHRQAPGGQLTAVDWTPGPFRLGRSLLSKVTGLLAPYTDVGSVVG